MESQKKWKIKIISLILAGILLLAGIFYGGKKFGESRYKKQIKAELETKITAKENEITSLKEQLKKETNSTKKQELEQKVRDLEQQLTQLKNLNIPSLPIKSPSQNPPLPIPPDDADQVEMEIKITQITLGDKNIRFDNNLKPGDWDSGKVKPIFIFISKKNPIWRGKNWDQIDWKMAPNFKISFLKKEASRHEKENTGWGEKENYYFDTNNTKLTLTPLGNWPDNPNPKTEKEVRFMSQGALNGNEYATFDNFNQISSVWQLKHFNISINHPLIRLLRQENGLIKDKKFIIKYEMADETKENLFFFNQNNQGLELYPL